LRVLSKSISESRDRKKMCELTDYLCLKEYDDILLELDFGLCMKSEDQNEVECALERIITWATNTDIDDEDKLLIAEFFIKHRNDTKSAYKWVENIEQPELCKSEKIGWDNKTLSSFSHRIRLNRILAALGIYVDPVKIIPNTTDERQFGIVLFERMLIRLSTIWGKAWAGETLTPGEVIREVRPAIIIFNRSYDETRDWNPWYQIRQVAIDYFRFLIRSVAAHGIECVVAIADEFNKQWQDKETKKYWPTEWQRHISLNIYKHDHSSDRLINQLCLIESQMDVLDDIYSRVNGMMEQAFAWIEAGECDRAKSLIPMIINASFGIYNDKDSQFNRWVDWLEIVNDIHKENSEERIKRFAGALAVLEQAGRGCDVQDGAAKLIEIAAKRHCGYAFYLRSWLMDHHAIHYVSSLEGIILAALKETEPPIKVIFSLVNHLLIPVQNSASEEIAELLALKCCQCLSEKEALSTIQTLIQAIETKAFPTERFIWWDGILKGLKATGVNAECVESKINEKSVLAQIESKPKIALLSGKKLTEADAEKRVINYSSLLTLLDSIKDSEHMSLEKILLRVIDNLTYEQVNIIYNRLNNFDRNSGAIMYLAKRMASTGHKTEAIKIIQEEYKRSPSSGWDVHYDGGSRLQIIETLISIDADYGRVIALKSLINDYISDVRYPENFIRNLNRLLNVLFDIVPVVEVWSELERHIYQLYDFSNAEDYPEIAMESIEELSFSEMLIKIMTNDYLLSVAEIREEAHGAICDAAFSNTADHILKARLLKLMNDDVRSQSSALAVLEAVMAKRSDFVSGFNNEIIQLCRHRNCIVRNLALSIADLLDVYIEEECGEKELPPVYKIELPELQMTKWTYPLDVSAEDDFGKHINDPIESVRPFLDYYEVIAEYTDIPLQNLIARASRIINSREMTNKYIMFSESELRSWLQAAELKLAFYRPGAIGALYTLGYIIGELIDAAFLDTSDFMGLIIHDPVLSVTKPVPRPVEVLLPEIVDKEHFFQKEDWMKKGREDLSLILNCMDNGNIILGELSRFINLNWEKPTEYRLSMVCHPDWPELLDIEDAYNFFPYSSGWYAREYPYLDNVANKFSAVIYSQPLQVEIGKTEWLAFNPCLAFHLGWKLSTEGLFRWVNKNGEIMVESIYWKDGPINRLPPRMAEICSEGWIVAASKKAAELISNRIGNAIYLKALVRQHSNRDERDVSRNSITQREKWKHTKNV
ncbi:MAG TPA: hypothetical protein PK733_14525, partial [Clostridiales bacterium]|nr:hypothetical protein [Clostridiales bacterium]